MSTSSSSTQGTGGDPTHDGGRRGAARAPSVWIVHRDPRGRAAIARLSRAADDTVLGSPTDDLFEAASEPDLILLGLTDDFELELEFAHRVSRRLVHARWILLADPRDADEARRLFDSLSARVVSYPPSPGLLARVMRDAQGARRVAPLSRRVARDLLAQRFAHWFADLELPDLVRALDPRMSRVPVLIRGEPGTGRGLLARYVHTFGSERGDGGGAFVHVPCSSSDSASDLASRIKSSAPERPEPSWTLWLEDADRLTQVVQKRVLAWIDYGLPAEIGGAASLRWIASASDEGASGDELALDEGLLQAYSALVVSIPPLRERPEAVAALVSETAHRWSSARLERPRRFSEETLRELQSYPWPGNLRELEALLERTLASTSADPIRPHHLRFDLEPPRELRAPPEPQADWTIPSVPQTDERGAGERPQAAQMESAGEASRATDRTPSADSWQRLVGAVAHEVRNPLTSLRTFVELLPERYDDPEFRERFRELVGGDLRRIENVVAQLQEMSGEEPLERKPVDLAAMLVELLDARRETIRARNLLVLRELDRSQPLVLADAVQLERALGGLLDRAIELVPERGDLYLASRHHATAVRGQPAVRVLLRFQGGSRGSAGVEGVSEAEASLEFAVAEAAIRAQGGTLTLDTTGAHETVVVIDLPAPPSSHD